ncbi:MAG: diguanylate cyclase, partial [Lachnospiraceae bacterium]|nr:diguanylate cyclase [Lachnospiraceae bacterium]
SLVESEGEYLSTSIQDIMGNYPYKTELEGIRENGEVFHFYYFKNKIGDDIQEKYSYAKYYEPFHWIISTGETIEEVYAYSKEINERNIQYIILLMFVFGGIFVLTSGIMIKILGKQAKSFQEKLYKQAELLEDMYTTMSIGMLRVAMTDKQTKLIRINPKGLELLGVETEQECNSKIQGHMIKTMYLEDAEKLTQECEYLTEQWTSVVVECRVKWKDESIHLLRIRNTLVDFDGEVKIIQRMCQDITEERLQQEKELMEAEEKATLDPMTQIKNKKAIEMIVRTNIRESAEKNVPIAVGFVDIDNFRDYNTKYGHLQGDEVIKYVASTLRDNIPGIVGRNGGDEFVFCILNASYQQVEESMKVIYKKLNEGVIIKESGEKIPTPCSIGIVIEQSATLQYNDVMEQSDVAMYESKSRGKNTYTILEHYENIK